MSKERRQSKKALEPAAEILLASYLTKQGKVRKNWKKRWVVLGSDGYLRYYRNASAAGAHPSRPKGWCYLAGCRVEPTSTILGRELAFSILPPAQGCRVYHMFADTPADYQSWLSALQKQTQLRPRQSNRFSSSSPIDPLSFRASPPPAPAPAPPSSVRPSSPSGEQTVIHPLSPSTSVRPLSPSGDQTIVRPSGDETAAVRPSSSEETATTSVPTLSQDSDPIGIVDIQLLGAKELDCQGRATVSAYVLFDIGIQQARTPVCHQSRSPFWNHTVSLCRPSVEQPLSVRVFDAATEPHSCLGFAVCDIRRLVPGILDRRKVVLDECRSGTIELSLTFGLIGQDAVQNLRPEEVIEQLRVELEDARALVRSLRIQLHQNKAGGQASSSSQSDVITMDSDPSEVRSQIEAKMRERERLRAEQRVAAGQPASDSESSSSDSDSSDSDSFLEDF